MGDELSRRQAQNGVNFDFEVKYDLEGQGQSSPKTIGILTKVFYTYGPNLVILAWTGDELSRGQTWWRTDGLTDGRTQATTIPEGQYWPRVKTNYLHNKSWLFQEGSHEAVSPIHIKNELRGNVSYFPINVTLQCITGDIHLDFTQKCRYNSEPNLCHPNVLTDEHGKGVNGINDKIDSAHSHYVLLCNSYLHIDRIL